MMKKLKSMFMLLVMITIFVITGSNNEINAKNENVINYLHADYNKDYSKVNLLEEFDYSFKGKIESYICTSQYNGYGTEIPYSYFKVKVFKKIKGDLPTEIIIKFYGGYDNDNNLILLENMSYPQVDEMYQFYCFKTNLKFSDDGRTINDSYPITMEYNMKKIKNKTKWSNDETQKNGNEGISILAITPDINIVDPGTGGGAIINDSFDTAHDLSINSSRYTYFSSDTARYYKTTRNTLDYLSVYSTGNTDVKVSIYDSNRNFLFSNDDVQTNHGKTYTSGYNFFLNFYADKDQTYYFKIELVTSDYGDTTFHLIKDNWTLTTDLSTLVWDYDGVDDSKKKVDYKIESKYISAIEYGIAEWNKLGTIVFQPDTGSTSNNIKIKDYTDSEAGASVAVTQYNWIFTMTVKYNMHYFESMSQNERIKTVLHEFGHVLGLDEFTNIEGTNNVMHQGIREVIKLGPADIAVYRYRWG